jgi:hypothetical protein
MSRRPCGSKAISLTCVSPVTTGCGAFPGTIRSTSAVPGNDGTQRSNPTYTAPSRPTATEEGTAWARICIVRRLERRDIGDRLRDPPSPATESSLPKHAPYGRQGERGFDRVAVAFEAGGAHER